MENLYYNLSEEEFSKERKILLWGFSGLFFLGAIGIIFANLVLGQKSIPIVLSTAPFGISLVVAIIAAFATFKGTELFFCIDDEKIEFKFGLFKPAKHTFLWNDIKELIMPHKQKKAKLIFKDGSSYIIDLTWMQKKKSSHIRKHIYHTAREKNLNVTKVDVLKKKN
jgi:hypothetical protein